MDDLASLTLQPRTLTVAGKTYLVHPFTIGDLGKLQAWVNAQYRNPMEVAAENLEHFTVAQQKYLMATAIELASKPKPKLGSEEADALCRSIDGLKETLYIAISKGDPSFTRNDASALFDGLTEAQIASAFEATQVNEVLSDPKAETTGETYPRLS